MGQQNMEPTIHRLCSSQLTLENEQRQVIFYFVLEDQRLVE